MEDKFEVTKIEKHNVAYKNKKTNTYRVFLNFPTWVGMKVIEVTVNNSKVKINVLAECIYQGNNEDVSKLYNEIVLRNRVEWAKIDSIECFIKCFKCHDKHCTACDNFIFDKIN